MKNNLLRQLVLCSKQSLKYFLLQLLVIQVVVAEPSSSQSMADYQVTLNVNNQKLVEVLAALEKQTDFVFAYNQQVVKDKSRISISKTADLKTILQKLTDQVDFDFKRVNNNIYVTHINSRLKIDEKIDIEEDVISSRYDVQITGKVTDDKGEPLPGASVTVAGTTTGTVTDMDGNYSITVPDGSTLVFSYIGFETMRVPLDNRSQIDITLMISDSSLDEVVVVGYGVQQKINLTGAISTVKFDDELLNRPLTNASQALAGTASGIWVSQNSGKPGNDEAQIRVRGWGTLGNANPLIIVDGVEGSFGQINPNDIESITVLKDAASAAIFGSKAANGVVLVTTKMGKKNEKMQVNVNSYAGIQSLGRRFDLIDNSAEHMEMSNQALLNDGVSPVFSDGLISAFRNGNDPFKYPNTDWFKELFRTASIQEHNISVTGGSENLSSFISFNYLNQDGIIPNTNSQRYGFRANVDSKVNNWLNLSARLNYINRDSKEPYADIGYGSLGRVFEMLGGAAPYIAPYTREGRFGSVQAIDQDGNLLYDNRNPLIDAANGQTGRNENILTLNLNADVKFNEHLSWRTTFASNQSYDLIDRFNTSVFGYTDTGIETITKNYNREGLEINRSQISSMQNNLFSTINFNQNFAEIHDISAIAGVQLETNRIDNVFARRAFPPKEGLTQVNAGTSGIQGEGNMFGFKIFSFFGRVNYSILNKYLFEANVRADGSSRFKEGNRWGVFPGFSAGWRLSEEDFIQNLGIFSNLKLRASWGRLGNQNIDNYWPYLTVINQSNALSHNFGGNFAPGAAVTALIDENITWETSTTLDLGVEVGFFDDRITLEADYFRKKTEGILVQLPIPMVMGDFTPPFENVGEMTNNGFEFILNYRNLKVGRDQLGFDFGINLTYIDNNVTRFQGGNSPDQLYLVREGYSYRTLYGFKAIGVYQSDAEAQEHMHANGFKPVAGDLKYEDLNNDGRLTFEDNQALGNTIPKFTFGFSPRFRYQGFDLNLLFQGIGSINAYTQNHFTSFGWESRVFSTRWRDAWSPENMDTDVPILKFENFWNNQPSSFWVQNLTFVKLRNIQLGYAFPKALTNRLGLQKIYMFANGQNIFTLVNDEYEGYDPERNTFDSGFLVYPVPRILTFGLNLNF